MPGLKRENPFDSSSEAEELPQKRTAIRTRIYSHSSFKQNDEWVESDSDSESESESENKKGERVGEDTEASEYEYDEHISVGSSSSEYPSATSFTFDEEGEPGDLNERHDDEPDDDEQYARLLQQQEIALARSFMQDGYLGHELLDAMESEASFDMSYESLLELQENLGEVKRRGLDDVTIRALTKEPYTEAMRHGKDGSSCVVCMIEYNEDEQITHLPCEHFFHADCAQSWLRVRASCPVCRKSVPEVVDLS
jgi:hypothetical protein